MVIKEATYPQTVNLALHGVNVPLVPEISVCLGTGMLVSIVLKDDEQKVLNYREEFAIRMGMRILADCVWRGAIKTHKVLLGEYSYVGRHGKSGGVESGGEERGPGAKIGKDHSLRGSACSSPQQDALVPWQGGSL